MGRFVSITAIGILTAIFLAAFPLCAQTNDPGMEKQMENQGRRIDQSVKSGVLTPKEEGNLEAQQPRLILECREVRNSVYQGTPLNWRSNE